MNFDVQIGPRLREMRKRQSFTLEALAEKTDLTKGYLSKIENGKKVPPIATLSRISMAMNCDISFFFQGDGVSNGLDDRVSIVRSDERQQVIRGGSSFGYDYESVAHKKQHKAMEPFVFTFPADIKEGPFFEHDGEEFLFILSGTVEVEFADNTVILDPGDTVYFDSSVPHRGKSVNGKATALVVIYRRNSGKT